MHYRQHELIITSFSECGVLGHRYAPILFSKINLSISKVYVHVVYRSTIVDKCLKSLAFSSKLAHGLTTAD